MSTGSKQCCSQNLTDNVNIGVDEVNGKRKNVLMLTAVNYDVDCEDTESPSCHKQIKHAGMVQTTAHFASARYEVTARVPQAEVCTTAWARVSTVLHLIDDLP